jgi:DNA-binding NtrC family response regulator
LNYHRFITDATISTLSKSSRRGEPNGTAADELLLLLECDRPAAASMRHRLEDIDEVVIGRGTKREAIRQGRNLTIKVPDGRISTAHATLRREGPAIVLRDAGSKNGVLVNGVRVTSHLLREHDVIECGHTLFLYRVSVVRPADEPRDVDCAALPEVLPGLLTFHPPLAEQLAALPEIARTPIPVVVYGATGTGKELVARAIHTLSQRRGAFVGLNCGALPENLVEAELFGARRGAFTGAVENRTGLVRASDEGTLFLDEVGELPERAQPTLLRVLQEREVLAVGTVRPVAIDLRLVAATHRNLETLVEQQQFRADLLARISGVVLHLPMLRERLCDFGMLVSSLLVRHTPRHLPCATISVEAMRVLLRHPWSLNVRELEHCLRAALALSPQRIEVAHLPPSVRDAAAKPAPATTTTRPSGATPRPLTAEQQARRAELCALLAQTRGNLSEVARRMGKDRVQIRRWLKMFQISAADLAR